ncbi:MAG: IS21 family transposase [Actinomycetota bacterium]|nr:IS21 family transposase [Actinomycetota bacterium]
MPRPHTAMRNVRDVLRLSLGEGLSLRKVSASAAAPFSTVADYVRRAKAAGLSWPLPDDMDDDALEALLFNAATSAPAAQKPVPDWAYVHKELRKKSVTLMLLWLEYEEAHPDGWGYSQFTEHYRRWRQTVDLPMRQEHKAGEKLFVDFPGETLPVYDEKTGEVAMAAELFVAALGASGLVYAEAFPSQELIYWVAAHVHTFEAIGGCPEIVVCDNLRSGVTKPHRYEPDVNATYQEMAAHYGVAVLPARAYKPKDNHEDSVIPRTRGWSSIVALRAVIPRDNYVSPASLRIRSSSPFQIGAGSSVGLPACWIASRTI